MVCPAYVTFPHCLFLSHKTIVQFSSQDHDVSERFASLYIPKQFCLQMWNQPLILVGGKIFNGDVGRNDARYRHSVSTVGMCCSFFMVCFQI